MSTWNKIVVQCDYPTCDVALGAPNSFETAGQYRIELSMRGWSTARSGGIDYCPAHSTAKLRRAADAAIGVTDRPPEVNA